MEFGGRQGALDPVASFRGDKDAHLPPVRFAFAAGDKPRPNHTVDRLRHRWLTLQGAGGELPDRHAVAIAEAGQNAPFRDLQAVLFQVRVELRTYLAARARKEIQEIVIDETISHLVTISKIYSFSYKKSCATVIFQFGEEKPGHVQ